MAEASKVTPPASVTETASKGPQPSRNPSVNTLAKGTVGRSTGSGSKAGTAAGGSRQSKQSSDVRSKIPAKDSDGAAKRLTAEEKGKTKAVESQDIEPMDIDAARGTTAGPSTVRAAQRLEDPLGLCTIWNGPVPDNSEEAQLRKRTEIIHRPSFGSHRQLMYSTPSNDAREGHFRDRHLTALQFSQQDLEDMQELRETSMELAAVAKNRYPPIGYDMEDLITLHAYKPVPSPALSQDRLGDRLVIWGLLEIQGKVRKQEAQLFVLEEQLQTLQTLFLNEDWITDKITEMLDERDAVWNEPHEQQEAETYTNTGTGEQSELLTHTLTSEQNDAAGTENLVQASEVPNVHMDVDSTGPVHPQGPQPPQEQQLPLQPQAPLQPQDPQQHQPEPTPPPSGSVNPAQNVEPPAAPVPAAEQNPLMSRLSTLRYMKTVPEFMGNKPKPGDKQRSWEEWKSEFMQNAEACGAHPVHYQVMAELRLSSDVRDQWMHAKATMDCDTWAGMNKYMSSHYAPLDKTVEAERRYINNSIIHETEKAWQQYCNSQTKHVSEMGPVKDRSRTDEGLWRIFLGNIPDTLSIKDFAFNVWINEKDSYTALDVQAKIVRITPVVLEYIKARNVSLGSRPAASAAAAGPRSPGASTGQGSSKRQLPDPYTPNRAQTQRPRPADTAAGRSGSIQADSHTQYTTVPTNVDYKQCPDVGYNFKGESKPYNHELNQQLQAAGRCLVGWANDHRIHQCPNRSRPMQRDMEAKRYYPRPPQQAYLATTLTKEVLLGRESELRSTHEGVETATGDTREATGVATEATKAGVADTKVPQQHSAELTHLHSVHASPEQFTQTGGNLIGSLELSRPARKPCSTSPEPDKQAASSAAVSPGLVKQAASGTVATTETNENSAPNMNQNLNMMGTGLAKLANVHYVFDPDELAKVASETRPFTRDGFSQGNVHRHPVCSTDACYLPDKPFECCDHRGHHCWLDPPVNGVGTALDSYTASKRHDPSNTSMCILVPVMRKATWWTQVKKMQRVRMYPKGSEILTSGLDKHTKLQVPYRSAIFYDPPSRPATLSAVADYQTGTQHHMSFTTEISGKKAKVLLDTGASQNFISKFFCEQADLKSVAATTPQKVQIAGGTDILTNSLCQVSFQLARSQECKTGLFPAYLCHEEDRIWQDTCTEHSKRRAAVQEREKMESRSIGDPYSRRCR